MDNEHHVKKAFLISMIVSLSISVLIGIVIFLLGSFGETQTRILLTTLTIVGFSLAGLCSATLYDKQNYVQPVRNYSCSIRDLNRIKQFCIRLFGLFAILDVLGTIITPIIYKVTKMKQQDTSFSPT